MATRLTLRLDQPLHKRLQTEARLRHTTVSALVRAALQQVLGQPAPSGVPSAPPGDAWEMLLTRCPDEVQLAVRQVVDGTGLGVANVLRSLVIAAVTGAAGTPPRPGASLDAPASSRVSGERTEREDSA